MARPEVQGLKYFPLDVGFFRDKRIRLLRGEHGADGLDVYLRLICKCYEDNGYYIRWDDTEDYALLADETGYSGEKIRLILATCLRRSLFDDTLFQVGKVLSSRSIQRRYFHAIKDAKAKAAAQGRYTYIEKRLCLLTQEDFSELNKPGVWLKVAQNLGFSENNDSKSGNNADKSENNPVKKSKGKKSKGKDIITAVAVIDARAREDDNDDENKLERYKTSVMLTEKQVDDLLSKMGLDGFDYYLDKLDDFITKKGARVKNHYQTMLKWWAEDSGAG